MGQKRVEYGLELGEKGRVELMIGIGLVEVVLNVRDDLCGKRLENLIRFARRLQTNSYLSRRTRFSGAHTFGGQSRNLTRLSA